MSTYLVHHGIPGQKWGVRNGPPYPLSRSRKNITGETFNKIKRIHDSLTNKEKRYLGEQLVSKYTKYANVKDGAYIILDDYKGAFKDVHPHDGLIISIASSKKSRGTGATDYLIKQAIKDNKNSRLIAEIDEGNIPSEKLFKRNGFTRIDTKDGIMFYEHVEKGGTPPP